MAALPASAQQPAWAWDDGTVPYVQTPMEIVERMLRMAEVGRDDYVIDLGSGDGRIIIEAAKRGARGMGVDLDPNLVKLATENARKAGVANQTQFVVKDIFETDLSAATVVAFYLLPDFNAKLLPALLKLKPGTRIVSHDGGIGDWPPDGFSAMVAYTSPVFWTFFLLTAITLFVFRRREGAAPAFRVPLYPIVPIAFCAACVYMLYSSINYVRFAVEFGVAVFAGLGIMALGIPLYFIARGK